MKYSASEEIIQKFAKKRLYQTQTNGPKEIMQHGVIPKIFHKEYLNQQHCNSKDILLDTVEKMISK